MEFLVEVLACEQVFLSVLQFSLVSYHFTNASLDQGSQTYGPPVYFMQSLH